MLLDTDTKWKHPAILNHEAWDYAEIHASEEAALEALRSYVEPELEGRSFEEWMDDLEGSFGAWTVQMATFFVKPE